MDSELTNTFSQDGFEPDLHPAIADLVEQLDPAVGPEADAAFSGEMADISTRITREVAEAGGELKDEDVYPGSLGRTMFDTASSQDNTVTILLPPDNIQGVPARSLLRIGSRKPERGGDGHQYLAMVLEGPFAEPDGLRADAPIVVTTTVRGTMFMPRYHGRIQAEILGEEVNGALVPPRFRPLPNSPIYPLTQEETAATLKLEGPVKLGLAVGYADLEVGLPVDRKDVFPRHFGILGTTGGGKSTTVSGLVGKLARNDVAVIIFDTEGEYTEIMYPTDDPNMLIALQRRSLAPEGVDKVGIYHLVGRETTNPDYRQRAQFCLEFSQLSPYAVMEILELNDAQQERYLKAYDITKQIMMRQKIYPQNEAEKAELFELDEMERGFPRMTLQHIYDITRLCADNVAKEEGAPVFQSPDFQRQAEEVKKEFDTLASKLPGNVWSWRKVQGSLSRLLRLKIFDNKSVKVPNYEFMTRSGRVTIVDLSDTDSPQINNLVISEILRGLRLQQEENYRASEEEGKPLRKVMIVIEEAHEFLSSERVRQMPVLFQQVARIARRGRKRWLGLTFVTQLPQHLPDEVLGLINNYILHKIADANVINRLKRSIGSVDDGLWNRLPNLAAGQAIVSTTSLARPLLVAIDPTPHRLRMTE